MVGVPVIVNHKDLTSDNVDDERVGVVNSVWYDEKDGWYWCDGIIWDEAAQNLITDKNWSVSCSYDVKTADNKGGSENNIKYDMEFLDGVFTHLALVNNPRYERANIVFNSKTFNVDNFNPNQKRNEYGQWCKDYDAFADKIKEHCETKGYIVQKDYSKSTNSIYLKLFKDIKDLGSHNYFKAIRIADHESEQGDKDIMVKYSDSLDDIKALIDNTLSKKVDKEQLDSFNGVIIDSKNIHPELNFEGKEIPQIKKTIENFYNKYLKTFNKSENTYSLSKDGIDLGFSNKFLNVLTSRKDFKLAQILLSNIKEIVDKGSLNPIDETKKLLRTSIFENNDFYDLEFPIIKDQNGHWIIDVLKTIIDNSRVTDGKPSPRYSTAINIINDDSLNFNPNVNEYEVNNNKEQEMALLEELKKLISRVENGKESDMEEKIENAKVDKRDIIRQIMAIAGKEEASEDVKTIAKLAEKLAYDKSEAGTADNKKVKNEEDKKEEVENKKCKNEDEEKADNKKCKNEDEEDKEKVEEIEEDVKKDIDNKKVKNSKEESSFEKINAIYNSIKQIKNESKYTSRQDKLDAAKEYFS